jgi:NitT/TauT family transport system substrate-binding protein
MKNLAVLVIVFGCFLGVWEWYSNGLDQMLFVLPPPSGIVRRFFESSDRFLMHTGVTLKEMGGGFCLAFALAFPLAWIMSCWKTARLILQPLFVVIQCIPMFALAPIMVIWFDWSYTAILIPTALMIFFPLTMNLYQGFRSIPEHYLDYFRLNQATPWQIFTKLQVPWAVPYFCSGVRISAAIAGIGAVAGEWAGGQSGLGVLMLESRRGADLEAMFASFACLTFVSLTLYGLALIVEKKVVIQRGVVQALSLFLALCLLSGCEKEAKSEASVRLMLDWLPNPNHVPLYAGVEKGFFAEKGIELRILKIHDEGDVLSYLTNNQADMAVYYMPDTIRANHRGADLRVIAPLIQESLNGMIYRMDSGIRKPADLNGKVLGYAIDGTSTRYLEALLDRNGIVPKDLKNITYDLLSPLVNERVDAVYGGFWNIEVEQLKSAGVDVGYLKLREFGVPDYYALIFVADARSKCADPAFMRRFQDALAESIAYSVSNLEEAFALYLKANPDKGAKTRAWERRAWAMTAPLLAKDREVDSKRWEDYKRFLEMNGFL